MDRSYFRGLQRQATSSKLERALAQDLGLTAFDTPATRTVRLRRPQIVEPPKQQAQQPALIAWIQGYSMPGQAQAQSVPELFHAFQADQQPKPKAQPKAKKQQSLARDDKLAQQVAALRSKFGK